MHTQKQALFPEELHVPHAQLEHMHSLVFQHVLHVLQGVSVPPRGHSLALCVLQISTVPLTEKLYVPPVELEPMPRRKALLHAFRVQQGLFLLILAVRPVRQVQREYTNLLKETIQNYYIICL